MKTNNKRIAYLAPELPSLSATFVTNEIWALEDMGEEIHPYSIHRPQHNAHGQKAADLAARTSILYEHNMKSNLRALKWTAMSHKRSFTKATLQLTFDVIKTGLFRKKAIKLVYQFLHGAWLAKDMRSKNIEHLHIHFAHVPTQIGMYASALAGIPFTFMAHANDIFERPLLIKEKIKRSHKTISISNFNINVMAKYGGNTDKIEIVRCGVDSNSNYEKPQVSPNSKPVVIGTLGRLVEKKGIDTLIDAAAILAESRLDFRIEVAGDGPLMDDLKQQVKAANLSEVITFLGSMPHTEALGWIKTLDAFVLAGKKDSNGDMDGIPVFLMEDMNFGIPVISTQLSGIPELVIHKQTGLLCPPDDADSLAMAIQDLFRLPEQTNWLAEVAKERIVHEFDQDLNAKRLLHIFNQAA